jgi:hypothetical protein
MDMSVTKHIRETEEIDALVQTVHSFYDPFTRYWVLLRVLGDT